MFNSVIVATDVDAGPDRAVPFATSLAGLGDLLLEVLTVVSAHHVVDDLSRRRVSARAPGVPLCVIGGDDVATAIVDHVADRDGALLVMTTTAKGLLSQQLRGSVSGRVLSALRQPVLLVGPAVPAARGLVSPSLVVCTDRSQDSEAALPVVESWQRTFTGTRPWIVEVTPTAAWPESADDDAVERAHLTALAATLADHGIDVGTRLLHGGEPTEWLLDFARGVEDAVLVTTSSRWAGGRSHWYSTTRRLVQRSPHPVLVIPADRPGY